MGVQAGVTTARSHPGPKGIAPCAGTLLVVKDTMPCRERLSVTRMRGAWVLVFLLGGLPLHSAGIDLEQTRQLLFTGQYEECVRECQEVIGDDLRGEEWILLLAQAKMALGRYPEAAQKLVDALEYNRASIRLRLMAYEALRASGNPESAQERLLEINELAAARIWSYRDAANLTALGRAACLFGADAKRVMDRFFDPARAADSGRPDAWLASGQLALDKQDYELAGRLFSEAVERFPDHPDVHFGLAQAFAPSDAARTRSALEAALRVNPHHAPSLLMLADRAVDAERYDAARELLAQVQTVNPVHPEAWAYHAVLHHLENNPQREKEARAKALQPWAANPAVDHLIGRKLSQNYRFREGAAHQRQALAFDPDYLPAKKQLAQDLLRWGHADQGWELAHRVHERDPYDVTAYNLVTLHDTLAGFETLTRGMLVVRMSPREAALYGDRVLSLLDRADRLLREKYQVTLEEPVTIEIFPDQKDFAVRTFGMPHNPGFLGVCFGNVVTANSPAAQPNPVNWEAVLWHEFAHVITLNLTRNKMPRWLSEGLSVHEEREANPSWGQHMNPRYREMILGQDLTPVGQLSGAFLAPPSPLHLQFAYYQSSLVVEFIIEQFGWDAMLQILRDLGDGIAINDALAAHTVPIPALESAFESHARSLATNMAPHLDWTRPPNLPASTGRPGPQRPALLPAPPTHPTSSQEPLPAPWPEERLRTNYWALRESAQKAIRSGRWEEAIPPLQTLIRLYPDQRDPDNAYALLAQVHQQLQQLDQEREVLARWAALDHEAVDAYLRLMELGAHAEDWHTVAQNAERLLAVNPLLPRPYLALAEASESLGDANVAINAWRRALLLGPMDPVQAHYRLARLLHEQGDPAARRHILQALEDAPRFREAHRLLLDLSEPRPASEPGQAGEHPPPPEPEIQAELHLDANQPLNRPTR
jgi:tetratricopeptide (TPR) repeat protein